MIMSLKQMKLNHEIYIEFYDVIAKKMCRITFKIDRGFYPAWQALAGAGLVFWLVYIKRARRTRARAARVLEIPPFALIKPAPEHAT